MTNDCDLHKDHRNKTRNVQENKKTLTTDWYINTIFVIPERSEEWRPPFRHPFSVDPEISDEMKSRAARIAKIYKH
jgi:hypothetical protein